MNPNAVGVAIATSLALLVGAWLARAGASLRRRWRQERRIDRALEGERRAEVLLRRLGYEVLGSQVAATYQLAVDGCATGIQVRADYLVARSGRRYVAEVKTGRRAPLVETPATRRQLLEYRIAFDVDGVLLVDAERGRVAQVVFPLRAGSRAGRTALWLALATAIGALAAWFAHAWL